MIYFEIMKRYILIICVFFSVLTPLWAQEGLSINAAFDTQYTRRNGAKEVVAVNVAVGKAKMTLFKSLTIPLATSESESFEQWVLADEKIALDTEQGTKNGRIYYAFMRLPNTKKGLHRYIFYRNDALRKGAAPITTIIYIEGTVTMADLRKQFSK
jgi:hypothetical protein